MNGILFSIVIPTYGREKQLVRAVDYIKTCIGYDESEIIVIDDASVLPISIPNLRVGRDKVIRNNKNSGGAVSRNVGIRVSEGQLIYLLDSDDYFLERNFHQDLLIISNSPRNIYYCQVQSQGSNINYPDAINREEYVDFILKKFDYIGQTSSLVFSNKYPCYFDESLPKHQDWDFVWSNYMCRGLSAVKLHGKVFFDRSDSNSISRKKDYQKSLPFINKITDDSQLTPQGQQLNLLKFCTIGSSRILVSNAEFFKLLVWSLKKHRLSLKRYLKLLLKRYVLK